LLHSSPLVAIRDVRCLATRGHGPQVECSRSDDIVFPRRGAFVRTARGREAFADASAVLFFNRGETYRVHHPIEGGDDCTVLTFAPSVLAEALGQDDALGTGGAPRSRAGTTTFPHSDAPAGARASLVLQRLRARITSRAGGDMDDMELDETALRLLEETAAAIRGWAGRAAPARRPDTTRAHRETAHAVRAILAREFPRRLTLDAIASRVHVSPFHLGRIFGRETGAPIHRHLMRLRLRAAIERMADGAEDLTSLALDMGFSSHSHFADAFRREFGRTPSRFRLDLTSARLDQIRKNLEVSSRSRA
jgi:AraC-like DNA-binding protein